MNKSKITGNLTATLEPAKTKHGLSPQSFLQGAMDFRKAVSVLNKSKPVPALSLSFVSAHCVELIP